MNDRQVLFEIAVQITTALPPQAPQHDEAADPAARRPRPADPTAEEDATESDPAADREQLEQ